MTVRWVIAVLATGLLMLTGAPAEAGSLANLIPNLFGSDGIVLASPGPGAPSHEAHFRVDSRGELTTVNDALRGQLGTFPVPSPASGFTFQFDPNLGVFSRSTESFGPIFAERADTIGRGRFSLGVTYSHFTFDKLDGKDLHDGSLQLVFRHEPTGADRGLPPFFFEADTVTAKIFAEITEDLVVLSANYGILDNLDVGLAVPIVRIDMKVKGVATINRIGTAALPGIHRFLDGSDTLTVRASDESTGLGDILLRGKYNFYREKALGLAAALDLRLPTGDADELRGLDTVRVRPFLIASSRIFGISPHAHVGFDLGDSSAVDNELFYNVGFDWPIIQRLTFAFDLLGRYIIDNTRPKPGRAPGSGEITDDHIINASFGVKFNPWQNVLLLFNLLVALNDTGLRDDITPLVGLQVSF
ncbi:MAG: transporter [Candidatus Rokubacteria bacterium]|nr:transporter [Candidatus Rokubacteria bacterium]